MVSFTQRADGAKSITFQRLSERKVASETIVHSFKYENAVPWQEKIFN
jgi:hypothetical protein